MKKYKFSRIFRYFKPYQRLVGTSMILAFLINAAELASPYIMKIAIDEFIIGQKTGVHIQTLGLLYLTAVIAGAFFNYSQVFLLNTIVQKIIFNIRMELFSHLQRMPLAFFDRNSSGRILTRATNDVEALNEMYSGVLVAFFKDIFLLIGIIVVMIQLDLRLAIVSLAIIPVIIGITFFYKGKARQNFKRVRQLIAQINGFFAENISGMKLVQMFNRQSEKYRDFTKLNQEYNRASITEVTLMAIFKPSSELINSLSVAILIWYCTPGVFKSTIAIGVLYAFITYTKKFFEPINDLADKYNLILAGSVAAERIFELLDNQEGIEQPEEGQAITRLVGSIEFQNVWFSYNNQDWVLKNVSFKVNPGETVAFVGATGSGKSTIINLIGRFYEIQKGRILLDGVDLTAFKPNDLRRRIAVVMQDVFLFAGDIKSNIRLANQDISEAEVIKASEYVSADPFIRELPGGYSEEVKERGCTLSSGQRQLLSFARAVVFNPSILVLDEATANIDTNTELLIQASLNRISKDRTTLIIAHRLSTIKNADKIIVIHKGEIHETGLHEELMQQKGIYKSLYDMQFAKGFRKTATKSCNP